MTSLGQYGFATLLECEKLIAKTIEGDLTGGLIVTDVSAESLTLEQKWKIFVDASDNFTIKNLMQDIVSLSGNAHTGEITFLGSGAAGTLNSLTDVSGASVNGAMMFYNGLSNEYQFTNDLEYLNPFFIVKTPQIFQNQDIVIANANSFNNNNIYIGGSSRTAVGATNKSIGIGILAGQTAQTTECIAIGDQAGQLNQGLTGFIPGSAIAIGNQAGATNQSAYSIAIGAEAGETSEGINSISIGALAGRTSQGTSSIAFGDTAGANNQGNFSIGIGFRAGENLQSTNSIAIGYQAGKTTQGSHSLACGYQAGTTRQQDDSIAIGYRAGETDQSNNAISIGHRAGLTNQSSEAIAIGHRAGDLNQSTEAIAIGHQAGEISQLEQAIAIGHRAGFTNQRGEAIAIGDQAGEINQLDDAIAIGHQAGQGSMGAESVAIGFKAGESNLGTGSIAIGSFASENGGGFEGTIVINANSTSTEPQGANRTYITPIREDISGVAPQILTYSAITGEVTRQNITGQLDYGLFTGASNRFGLANDQTHDIGITTLSTRGITVTNSGGNNTTFQMTNTGFYEIIGRSTVGSSPSGRQNFLYILDNANTELAVAQFDDADVNDRVAGTSLTVCLNIEVTATNLATTYNLAFKILTKGQAPGSLQSFTYGGNYTSLSVKQIA